MKNFEAVDIINQYCYDNNITGKENIAFNLAMQALNHSTSDLEDTIKHNYKKDCIKLAEDIDSLRTENTELKNLIIELSKKLVRSDTL